MNPQITRAPTGSMLDAVHEHHATGDIAVLRRALRRHDSKQPRMPAQQPDPFADAVYRGLLSFNLWPANADETYQAIVDDMAATVGDSSESDAIALHWRAVGEYLSYGIAKYAASHEPSHE